jgi:hypothetical protein
MSLFWLYIVRLVMQLTLLNIPPFSAGKSQGYTVRVLQLDPSTNTAADGTCMLISASAVLCGC